MTEYTCLFCGNEDQELFCILLGYGEHEHPTCDVCGDNIAVYAKDQAADIEREAALFVQKLAQKA
jgi:transcription elongation factor Elf1